MKIKQAILPALLGCTALALLSQVFSRPAAGAALQGRSYPQIESYIEARMRQYRIPGAVLVVVENGELWCQRGYGEARPGGEIPGVQTPFMIGSLSKSFTALAVMQLVEEGRIGLDNPVQQYLPWFQLADPQAAAAITIRHLLNQTSGIPAWVGEIQLADFNNDADEVERQRRFLEAVQVERPAGSGFEYNNANYNLLGAVIEAVSGGSYAEYVQANIFAPLGMQHSYAYKADAQQHGLAVGHRYWFGLPVAAPDLPQSELSLPTGQLISSAEDMGRYLIALLNGGSSAGNRILSEEGVAVLHTGAAEVQQMGMSFGRYGMGWFVDEIDGTRLLWHSGTTPDFGAFMALLPERNSGFILLFNANHHWMTPVFSDMGGAVAALLAGSDPAPTPGVDSIPWVLRALLLVPLLQAAGVVTTLRAVQRWRANPAERPARRMLWGRHILLPLIPNLLTASALLFILGKTFNYKLVYMPDVAGTSLVSGSFAALWSIVRSGLVWKANQPGPDCAAPAGAARQEA